MAEQEGLGLVVYRRTHQLDKPEEQARGWKAWGVFNSPQQQQDVDEFIRLHSGPGEWVMPYNFKVVPFAEQDPEAARTLQELANGLTPARRRWGGD